jgi:hypothetical protein
VSKETNVTTTKTIHSRSNKDIGDIIEGEWEITAKKVIAEPIPADGRQAPRFGIYEYQVKGSAPQVSDKPVRVKLRREPSVGGTRREAASVPLTVRRTS